MWRKASRSTSNGGACVEVALLSGTRRSVAARDSKDPAGPRLRFTSAVWGRFVAEAKSRAYDLR